MAKITKELQNILEAAKSKTVDDLRIRLSEKDKIIRALSASNHYVFGAINRLGNLILESGREGTPVQIKDVQAIVEDAHFNGGKSAIQPLVELLREANCPKCSKNSREKNIDACPWCNAREGYLS